MKDTEKELKESKTSKKISSKRLKKLEDIPKHISNKILNISMLLYLLRLPDLSKQKQMKECIQLKYQRQRRKREKARKQEAKLEVEAKASTDKHYIINRQKKTYIIDLDRFK